MTLMVFGIVVPVGSGFSDLWSLKYKFVVYALTFFTLAIYWRNHHHVFAGERTISTGVLQINVLFIFLLTLFPFITAWVGLERNVYALAPEFTFGMVMLAANLMLVLLDFTVAKADGTPMVFSTGRIVLALGVNLLALGFCFLFPPSVLIGRFIELFIWSVPPEKARRHRVKIKFKLS